MQDDNHDFCPSSACQISSGSSNNLADQELNCIYLRLKSVGDGSTLSDTSGSHYWETTKVGSKNCPVKDNGE